MSATAFLFDRSCLGPGGPFSVLIALSSALIIDHLSARDSTLGGIVVTDLLCGYSN